MPRSLRKGTNERTRPQRAPRRRTSSAAPQGPSVASRLLSRRPVRLLFPPWALPRRLHRCRWCRLRPRSPLLMALSSSAFPPTVG
eukprot:5689020-Prymnesium_polylepis.1